MRKPVPYGYLGKIEEKLELARPPDPLPSISLTVMVGNNMTANGDITINDITVSPGADMREFYNRTSPDRLGQIRERVSDVLKEKKIVLLLRKTEKFPSHTLTWFWQSLWAECLAGAVGSGLSVVMVVNTGCESDGLVEDCTANPLKILQICIREKNLSTRFKMLKHY